MTRFVRTAVLTAVLAAGGLSLAACGKQGELERPAPMWGAAEKAKYEADQRAAGATGNKASNPGSNGENIDPATSSATSRQVPVKGSNPDPFGGPSGPGFPNSGPQ